jgi:hypothetical protein
MAGLAITFFGTVLKRTGTDGLHSTRQLAPRWLEKHEPIVRTAIAFASADAICPLGKTSTAETSRHADTTEFVGHAVRPRRTAVRTAIVEGRDSACHTTSTAVSSAGWRLCRYQRNARLDELRPALARDRGARRCCIREKAPAAR